MLSSRYLFIVLFFGISSVFANPPSNVFDKTFDYRSKIRVGDWIFRKGVNIDSMIINQLGGGEFSHIGMVISVEDEIKIIHATTDDDGNNINQVIISTLAEFITPELAQKYAIARPNFISDTQFEQIIAELVSKQGAPFILAPRDKEHLYCTTFLYDAIIKFQPNFKVEWKYANFPLLNGVYLFPSAFANHENISWIYRYPEENQ